MNTKHSTLLSPPCHSERSEESLFSVIPLEKGIQDRFESQLATIPRHCEELRRLLPVSVESPIL